jgi:hypothetical protein
MGDLMQWYYDLTTWLFARRLTRNIRNAVVTNPGA